VLGFNLALFGSTASGVYCRVSIRLITFGALAAYPFVKLNELSSSWWPLNIMFTFLVITLSIWFASTARRWAHTLAFGVAFLGGALVEYWWPAVAASICAWAYFRYRSSWAALGYVACLPLFYMANDDFWAILAVPIVYFARHWQWRLPRAQMFFYVFYPAHLWVFFLVRPVL
jgi:TraX protein